MTKLKSILAALILALAACVSIENTTSPAPSRPADDAKGRQARRRLLRAKERLITGRRKFGTALRQAFAARPWTDTASLDIVDAAIGIFLFAAVIGSIVTQLNSAALNMTGDFAVAKPLLPIVVVVLVASLIYRSWKRNGRGRRA